MYLGDRERVLFFWKKVMRKSPERSGRKSLRSPLSSGFERGFYQDARIEGLSLSRNFRGYYPPLERVLKAESLFSVNPALCRYHNPFSPEL